VGSQDGFYSVEHGENIYISYREVQPYAAEEIKRLEKLEEEDE